MYRDDGAKAVAAYNAQNLNQAAVGNYASDNATKSVPASEAILKRLRMLCGAFSEVRSATSHAADKIVGAAPTPINSTGQIKGDRPPASCFLDELEQIIGELENVGRDTHEHINRIHRSF